MAQIRSALIHHILDHTHSDQEWEWGVRREPGAPASVQRRLPQADHCKWGKPGSTLTKWKLGQQNSSFLIFPPTQCNTDPPIISQNLGGGLGASCAWSIMPGSSEGEFQPIWIYLLWCILHLENNNLSRTRNIHGLLNIKKFFWLPFLNIWTFPFRQNWASFVQFSDKSESIFLSSSLLLPITLHDSLISPTHDEDHSQDISLYWTVTVLGLILNQLQ